VPVTCTPLSILTSFHKIYRFIKSDKRGGTGCQVLVTCTRLDVMHPTLECKMNGTLDLMWTVHWRYFGRSIRLHVMSYNCMLTVHDDIHSLFDGRCDVYVTLLSQGHDIK
jgi:hypothetical protein